MVYRYSTYAAGQVGRAHEDEGIAQVLGGGVLPRGQVQRDEPGGVDRSDRGQFPPEAERAEEANGVHPAVGQDRVVAHLEHHVEPAEAAVVVALAPVSAVARIVAVASIGLRLAADAIPSLFFLTTIHSGCCMMLPLMLLQQLGVVLLRQPRRVLARPRPDGEEGGVAAPQQSKEEQCAQIQAPVHAQRVQDELAVRARDEIGGA
jgi:hypothetical protein